MMGAAPSRVFAVIPAAGRSRRMGVAKQLLDIGGRSMLAAVVEPIAAARVAGVVVVTHSGLVGAVGEIARLLGERPSPYPLPKREGGRAGAPLAEEEPSPYPLPGREGACACGCPVFVALNDDENSEMIDSVRIGLAAWRARAVVGANDGFLVCPADQPGIAAADFDACIAAFEASPRSIIVATHGGWRGHPVIFSAELVEFVMSPACDQGLRAVPAAYAARVVEVECRSGATVRDLDTPEDYRAQTGRPSGTEA
jgi:molybdenum cofactor cytidylyltransferase